MGSNAFSDCVSLKTIALPEGIELIADYAFV
ncbi:MAG TPA: leucine-rich repeat domain-containing protein [Firmicutes bacterium]|nr:leucine-rich repeat domain-containing protein [Bacillota bacterium]